MAEDTLVAEAPGTIAEETLAPSETEETVALESVETDGADAGDETDDANDPLAGLTDEQIAANPRLKRLLAAKDFQHQQSLRDTREAVEREVADKTAREAYAFQRQQAAELINNTFEADLVGFARQVERGEHLNEDGTPKMIRLPDGRIMPWLEGNIHLKAYAAGDAHGLLQLNTLASLTPAQLKATDPDWKPDPGLTTALEVATRNRDIPGIWQAHAAIVEDALTQRLTPKLRKQVEAELAAAAQAEGVAATAATREKAPRPTSPGGATSAGNTNWRSQPSLSKGYAEGYRAEYGDYPPGYSP